MCKLIFEDVEGGTSILPFSYGVFFTFEDGRWSVMSIEEFIFHVGTCGQSLVHPAHGSLAHLPGCCALFARLETSHKVIEKVRQMPRAWFRSSQDKCWVLQWRGGTGWGWDGPHCAEHGRTRPAHLLKHPGRYCSNLWCGWAPEHSWVDSHEHLIHPISQLFNRFSLMIWMQSMLVSCMHVPTVFILRAAPGWCNCEKIQHC